MKRILRELWFQIIIAMCAGIVLGLLLSPSAGSLLSEESNQHLAQWIALPGHLFLSLIKMVVIPLVLSSIILGVASSGQADFLRKVSFRVLPYFICTTIVAIIVGISLALFIEPGQYISTDLINQIMQGSPQAVSQAPAAENMHLTDRIISLIPTNYVQSALNEDLLATVIIAVFMGTAMVSVKSRHTEILLSFFQGLQEISLKVIHWAMKLAPIAVFGLICNITMRVGFEAISGMAAYMATVILGLIVLLCFYLLIAAFLGRRSPFGFLGHIKEAQLMAFSTSSSAAAMPVSLKTAETKLGVKPFVARFIIPLGATINMDGTAMYQVCAAVFLTQVYGVELSVIGLFGLALTTVGASIGTPSTPGVGIVVLATILGGIGVPPSGIALIIGVDRILDMCRTTVNVTGDLTACTVMNIWLAETPEPLGDAIDIPMEDA